MKVLLFLFSCLAVSSAGIIGYHVAPLAYPSNYVVGHPFPAGPLGIPVPLATPYFAYNVIPGSVIIPGVPGLVHYVPVSTVSSPGKEKPDKKNPGDKKEEKETKEETTEEPKKGETEDLAE